MSSELLVHPFEPLYDENSEVLILGSFPSVVSRQQNFYYANSHNRFWPLMGMLFEEEITDREEFCHRHHIALWDVIYSLRKNENMTVFLTTHYMEEAAEADYVVIIDSGSVSAKGTPLELKNAYTGDFITIYGVDEEKVKKLGLPYEAIRDAYRVSVPHTKYATEIITKNPELFVDYEITKGKMDDVFLSVTGKKLTGGEEK